MRVLIGSILAVLLAGCASQPSAPTTGAATATTATTAPAAVAAPATAAAVAAPATSSTTAAKAAASQTATKSYPGYKQKTRDGQAVWCKKVAKIGSRFEEETCMTEAEMEVLADKAEQDRQQFRRNGTLCGTGGCGGT